MRKRMVLAVMLAMLLLISVPSAADQSSADTEEDDDIDLTGVMSDQILSGVDAVTDAISKRTDNLPLPSGVASVLEAVANDETSEPQVPAGSASPYSADTHEEEIHLAGGDDLTVNNATLTVDRLYIDSSSTPVTFKTTGTGRIVIGSLFLGGLIMPLPQMAVTAENASVTVDYQNGESLKRSLALDVAYTGTLTIDIGGHTVAYTSTGTSHIRISVSVDLTGYVERVSAPAQSTIDKLLRYIGSLDLVKLDISVEIGGTYGIADYPTPFQISDLAFSINSHKDQTVPYYGIVLDIGNVQVYPVNNRGMHIEMELPASRMTDGSRPEMDRARAFVLSADSISVGRVEPDDPLNVQVNDLGITIAAGDESSLAMDMGKMVFAGTVTNKKGTFPAETTVTGFGIDFKGTASDLLDNASGLIRKIIQSDTIDGHVNLGKIEYARYDKDGTAIDQKVMVDGLVVKPSFVFPMFRLHMAIDSFEYKSSTKDITSSSFSYNLLIGIDPESLPSGVAKIRDLLKLFEIRSVTEITADDGYSFTIDKGRAFITKLSTDGLRVICGDDALTFESRAVTSLTKDGVVVVSYHRLTADEIKDKVPKSVRQRLSDETVIELSNSAGVDKVDGTVSISIKTDLDPEDAGAYRIDTDRKRLVGEDWYAEDGHITFTTDTMGLHAVSGPLTEPDRTVLASGLLVGAGVLGAITVIVGRRFITRKVVA